MKKIVKNDLLNALAAKSGLTKADADKFLNAFAAVLQETVLGDGNAVPIQFLGIFKPVTKKERKGRNPKTGAEITIPASTTIGFKQSPTIKD